MWVKSTLIPWFYKTNDSTVYVANTKKVRLGRSGRSVHITKLTWARIAARCDATAEHSPCTDKVLLKRRKRKKLVSARTALKNTKFFFSYKLMNVWNRLTKTGDRNPVYEFRTSHNEPLHPKRVRSMILQKLQWRGKWRKQPLRENCFYGIAHRLEIWGG